MTASELEQLADLVAERLAVGVPGDVPRVWTADELAAYLRVTPATIRANADHLGAVRLGDGPRARLRFIVDRGQIREWQARRSTDPVPAEPPPARRRRKPDPRASALPPLPPGVRPLAPTKQPVT